MNKYEYKIVKGGSTVTGQSRYYIYDKIKMLPDWECFWRLDRNFPDFDSARDWIEVLKRVTAPGEEVYRE